LAYTQRHSVLADIPDQLNATPLWFKHLVQTSCLRRFLYYILIASACFSSLAHVSSLMR
jgi:hypothetical protein